MALYRQRAHERRVHKLAEENKDLAKDVGKLEDALALHSHMKTEQESSVRGILRKEIGGSIWQHGGAGRLSSYKSSKDLGNKSNLNSHSASSHSAKSRGNQKSHEPLLQPSVEKLKPKKETVKNGSMIGSKGSSRPISAGSQFSESSEQQDKLASMLGSTYTKSPTKSSEHISVNVLGSTYKKMPVKGENMQSSKHRTLNKSGLDKGKTGCKSKLSSPIEIPTVPVESNNMEEPSQSNKENKHDEMRVEVLSKMINKLKDSWNLDEILTQSKTKPDPIHMDTSNKGDVSRTKTTESKQMKSVNKESKSNRSESRNSLRTPDARIKLSSAPKPWDPVVADWLHSLNLKEVDKYVQIFMENEIDMDGVKLLSERQLKAMGVAAIGALNKIMHGIERLKQSGYDPLGLSEGHVETPSNPWDVQTLQNKLTKNHNTDQKIPFGVTQVLKSADLTKPTLPSTNRNLSTRKTETKSSLKHETEKQRKPHSASGTNRDKTERYSSATEAGINRTRPEMSRKGDSATSKSVKPTVRSTRTSRIRALQDAPSPARTPAQDASSLLRTAVQDVSPVSTDTEDAARDAASGAASGVVSADIGLVIDGSALGGDRQTKDTKDEDVKLQNIEDEIQALCGEVSAPGALDKINRLQEQLRHIQLQLASKKQPQATLDQLQQPGQPPDPLKLPAVQEEKESTPQPEEKVVKKEAKAAVISQKMSKSDLLKEVRKQKELHRREIRHLESELSRLKHKDPLRSCEILPTDVYFLPQDLIGEGAFSQVYRGFYQGSEVAVKQLKVPLSAQDKNYFIAEVNLLKELRHPRVVLLVGVCTSSTLPLMLLEFMTRGSLYHYLHDSSNAALDHAAYHQVARDTALGMNYLHMHRPAVLHLDLKSMNILLTSHLRAKIADFGFSKLKHEASVAARQSGKAKTTVKGTPAWLAPELLDNRGVSTKADVYSYGVILCEMLTRQHPYPGSSVFQIIERVRNNKRPEIPESCPKPLSSLISRCWDKNPARRPAFKDVLTSLEKLRFPPEWKALFARAGVPGTALDDLETTRSLISMVTRTLEGERLQRPSDVPALNLYGTVGEEDDVLLQDVDDDEDDEGDNFDDGCEKYAPVSASFIDQSFYQNLQQHLQTPPTTATTAGATERIDNPVVLSSPDHLNSFNNGRADLIQTDEAKDSPLREFEELERKLSLSSPVEVDGGGFDFSLPPSAPPPPPIPSFDWGGKSQISDLSKDGVFQELYTKDSQTPSKDSQTVRSRKQSQKNTDKSTAALRSSQLVKQRDQLRPAVEPHPSEKPAMTKSRVAGPRASIRASQLAEQRRHLLPTNQPHPNQLSDLAALPDNQIADLADILRKAVGERRTAMGNTATLDSLETAAWSLGAE